MKHLAIIQKQFLKEAANWDELSYEAQKEYLSQHPKSERKITSKPDVKANEKFENNLKKKLENYRKKVFDEYGGFKNYDWSEEKIKKQLDLDVKILEEQLREKRRRLLFEEGLEVEPGVFTGPKQNKKVTKKLLDQLSDHTPLRKKKVKLLAKQILNDADADEDVDGSDLTEDMLRDILDLPIEGENKDVDDWIKKEIDHFQDDVDAELDNLK